MTDKIKNITSEMTVLDIVSENKDTVEVFKRYDEKAGECICCNALFEPLEKVALKYGINLDELLKDLNRANAV